MVRFTYVEVYPATGSPDRLVDSQDPIPIKDAFVRSSRCVTLLYSEALETLAVDGYRSMLRFFCGHDARRPLDEVEVVVSPEKPGDDPGEMGGIRVPLAIGQLDARERAQVALEAVHAGVLVLAGFRGWDPQQLQRCHDHVVARAHEYRWTSPWKAGPGRRHEARLAFRLPPDDGWGRVRLEVRERSGPGPTSSSPEAIAFCTALGFRRSAGTLRWDGPAEVAATPYCGTGSAHYSGELRATGAAAGWRFTVRDDVTVRQPVGPPIGSRPSPADLPTVVAVPTS